MPHFTVLPAARQTVEEQELREKNGRRKSWDRWISLCRSMTPLSYRLRSLRSSLKDSIVPDKSFLRSSLLAAPTPLICAELPSLTIGHRLDFFFYRNVLVLTTLPLERSFLDFDSRVLELFYCFSFANISVRSWRL